jgi:hypothetical protein
MLWLPADRLASGRSQSVALSVPASRRRAQREERARLAAEETKRRAFSERDRFLLAAGPGEDRSRHRAVGFYR